MIQSPVIVRCRSCRTYLNPFVTFVDSRRWKCNLCYRNNECKIVCPILTSSLAMIRITAYCVCAFAVPEDFAHDIMRSNGFRDSKRPEIRYATVEFIAPQEYMVRTVFLTYKIKSIFFKFYLRKIQFMPVAKTHPLLNAL